MRRATRSQPRAVPKLAVLAGAYVALAAVAVAACITAPPPDLPNPPLRRPTAIHQAVQPAEGFIVDGPDGGEFTVPVEVSTPGDSFVYSAFLDGIQVYGGSQTAPEGGLAMATFVVQSPDTATCPHQIEFIVAHGWANPTQMRTPDAVGGDVVQWSYANGGPQGCPPLDAGSGAFPDASVDGLPVPPEAGGDP